LFTSALPELQVTLRPTVLNMRFPFCTDVVVNAYSELFDRMDLDNDGYLNKSELDQYMMRTEGAPVQDTAYHWLLHKFEGKEGA
jgi:Ca2+-binding EF-hand superfamily protein